MLVALRPTCCLRAETWVPTAVSSPRSWNPSLDSHPQTPLLNLRARGRRKGTSVLVVPGGTSFPFSTVLDGLWSIWHPADSHSGPWLRRIGPVGGEGSPASGLEAPPSAGRWERRIWQGAPSGLGTCELGRARSPALNVRKSPGQLGLCKVCFGKTCST